MLEQPKPGSRNAFDILMTSKTNVCREKVPEKLSQKSAPKKKCKPPINTTQQLYLSNKWGRITLQRPERANKGSNLKNKSGGQLGREGKVNDVKSMRLYKLPPGIKPHSVSDSPQSQQTKITVPEEVEQI